VNPDSPLLAFGVYAAAVVLLAAAIPLASHFLGERHRGGARGEPYESGILGTGSAEIRFDVRYYLVAVFFILFDIEAVFLFAWAVSLRAGGWEAYLAVSVFVAVLLASLVYLFRTGGFRWTGGPRRGHGDRAAGGDR